ncbi:2882_t:CDS:2 [Diversispora eburnea]|uniref:2882_t:CDS:1 n=1 Tax=Diversispora eburnea TaxID=1213867 RepID=A0A9N8YVK9_9GLOM|nr:2882_t:CDS:2 [Diversispora eburnea]
MYPLRKLYEWILLLCLTIAITWNLFTLIWSEIPPNTSSTYKYEIDLINQNLDSDLILENLFAPAENFTSPHLIDIEINQSFCHRSKCKFLFMYNTIKREFDDEFNAQRHFQMFINFTRQLNRTMILPNVGKSHISVCRRHSFNFYYSIENLEQMYPDVSFMLQSDFLRWTKERYIKPTVIQTTIIEGRGNGNHSMQPQLVDVEDLKDRNCLKEKIESIEFSDHLIIKASNISDHLDPYIAINWKMEQVKQENMVMCARKLIREVNKLKSQHNISNIYLATDYPLKNNLRQFYSLRNITHFHDKAIKTLRRKIKFKSWTSFDPQDQNGHIIRQKAFAESGIPGILDKLVCTRAKIFLTVPPSCKNIISDYSQGREKLLEENENEEFIQ